VSHIARSGTRDTEEEAARYLMNSERQQPEWLDLKALQEYACVSERTLREWIHRQVNPLPAVRVGTKILIRRSMFNQWLEAHQVKAVDVGCIVDEIAAGVMGTS
jgi:excisionase family DNA binding protein